MLSVQTTNTHTYIKQQRDTRKLLEVMDMIIILIVVTVAQVEVYTHKTVCINYVQAFLLPSIHIRQ